MVLCGGVVRIVEMKGWTGCAGYIVSFDSTDQDPLGRSCGPEMDQAYPVGGKSCRCEAQDKFLQAGGGKNQAELSSGFDKQGCFANQGGDVQGDFMPGQGFFCVRVQPSGGFFFVRGIANNDISRLCDRCLRKVPDILVKNMDTAFQMVLHGIFFGQKCKFLLDLNTCDLHILVTGTEDKADNSAAAAHVHDPVPGIRVDMGRQDKGVQGKPVTGPGLENGQRGIEEGVSCVCFQF